MGQMKIQCLFLLPSSPFLNKQMSHGIVTDANLENLPVPAISIFKHHFGDSILVAFYEEQACVTPGKIKFFLYHT